VIGKKEKLQAHVLGLLHRAFSVFIFRNKNGHIELLLQQRHQNKYHCGGLWSNTCCSHPREGENIQDAGKRRLKEEMGINLSSFKHAGTFHYEAKFNNGLIENELDAVLTGYFDSDSISFNSNEVQDVRWVTLKQLEIEYAKTPEKFTPWFKPALTIATQNTDRTIE
jgi:isopentenyl-diphosphate delta-isomerase